MFSIAEKFSRIPMSFQAWAALDEDVPGEWVDGNLTEEELPSHLHEFVTAMLLAALHPWAQKNYALLFGSEHKIAVSPVRGRKPDISLYPPGKRLPRKESVSKTPPLLVVEVLSFRPCDVRRDRLEKAQEYAAFGIPWYWLLDPSTQLLEVFRLGPSAMYAHALVVGDGVVKVPGLDGFELNLTEIWDDAGRKLAADDDDTPVPYSHER